MAGKKWTERDLDAPRRYDEDEALRYIAAGATEKGARWWSASRHRCFTVPCAGARRHERGSETEQEKRKVSAKSWQTRDTAASFGGGRVVRLCRESTVRAAYSYAV